MKKYRYIYGNPKPTDRVSDGYRLIGSCRCIPDTDCIRITIPDDMILEHDDGYSTTEDNHLIKDLDPKAMVVINGKLTANDELLKKWLGGELEASDFIDYMEQTYDMTGYTKFGLITRKQYRFASKFCREVFMLDRIPDVDDLSTYQFPYKFDENKDRIAALKKFFNEYDQFSDEIRNELQSWDDKRVLCEIYRYALSFCQKSPGVIDRHLKSDPIRVYYHFKRVATDSLSWRKYDTED